jgi:hypothetical protein
MISNYMLKFFRKLFGKRYCTVVDPSGEKKPPSQWIQVSITAKVPFKAECINAPHFGVRLVEAVPMAKLTYATWNKYGGLDVSVNPDITYEAEFIFPEHGIYRFIVEPEGEYCPQIVEIDTATGDSTHIE